VSVGNNMCADLILLHEKSSQNSVAQDNSWFFSSC
jgi:hypothetical protein